MVHEARDQKGFFCEIFAFLKTGGMLFIAEPKIHVSKKAFNKEIAGAKEGGFKVHSHPRVAFSHAALLIKG